MQPSPFLHVAQCPSGKGAANCPGGYFHSHLEFSVYRMEMRWRVVAIVHRDCDAEEATDGWHAGKYPGGADAAGTGKSAGFVAECSVYATVCMRAAISAAAAFTSARCRFAMSAAVAARAIQVRLTQPITRSSTMIGTAIEV